MNCKGKRLFDIVGSFFGLLLLLPFLVIVSIAIKSTSKGPVFYKSLRLGKDGKIIGCWKFRSMYADAEKRLQELLQSSTEFRKEWNVFQKVQKDPRITPLGHFLRKTSMDELPQFWNVLKGDLSLVGPRPPTLMGPPHQFVQEIRTLYGEKTDNILSVRPGITGVWQISGRSRISFAERCAMEEQYALNHSFKQDLVILLKTIPVVFSSKGAF